MLSIGLGPPRFLHTDVNLFTQIITSYNSSESLLQEERQNKAARSHYGNRNNFARPDFCFGDGYHILPEFRVLFN